MPRPLRAEVFDPKEVCVVHCVQRCVRRAFLTGFDKDSGKDYQYRREWIRERMEKLASVFGIDCLTYAILSNHLHVVLRSRPDVVETWSDKQVALRWLQIFPGKRIDEQLGDPTTVGPSDGATHRPLTGGGVGRRMRGKEKSYAKATACGSV